MERFYASGCVVIDSTDNVIVRYLKNERDAILCAFVMNYV